MQAVTQRASSRLASAAGVAVVVVALILIQGFCADSLVRTHFLTGWGLLLAIGVQADRRWRKVRHAGASAEWLGGQGGLVLVAVMLFGMHLDFQIPDGWLDSVLAGMFVLLLASSVAAALLLRTLRKDTLECCADCSEAPHVAAHGEICREGVEISRALAAGGAGRESVGAALADYFEGPRHFWGHLFASGQRLRTLLSQVDALRGDADPSGARDLDRLLELVIASDRLDAQYAGRKAVRRWLLFHMSLIASVLTLGAMHGVLAHTHSVLAHIVLGR